MQLCNGLSVLKEQDLSYSLYDEIRMEKLTRRYVYGETYAKIMEWASFDKIRTPNHKENFAYCIREYIERLEQQLVNKTEAMKNGRN